MIDYVDLIGVPFAFGGRGPDAYDCYGLVMEMERRSTGREVPDYRSPDVLAEIATIVAAEKYRWTCFAEKVGSENVPYKELQPGRVMIIRVNGLACHVGYIHRPRRFLHTWEGTGGVIEETIELWRQRILGVYGYG